MAEHFCREQVVANDSADHAYALDQAARLFTRAGLFVMLDVGAGIESVALRLELSPDSTTWYRAHVWDPAANAYAAAVTLTADTQRLIAWVDNYAPYLRLVGLNTGANSATLTAFLTTQ